ncbi:hypothetical protein [Arsenicicoccus piscis]|uniref:Amidase domain-containing protein n=1 Tax=Arsenicicoccus piscis TaxID=673954 RepID=A0ABQ6HNZ9_9MICO|nr:hypothetical protein GCM10025862_22070 [Arsenicicoccus piscis]
MTTDLTRLSAAQMAEQLASGAITSVELTQAHLDRIAAVDGAVHAYLHVDAEGRSPPPARSTSCVRAASSCTRWPGCRSRSRTS